MLDRQGVAFFLSACLVAVGVSYALRSAAETTGTKGPYKQDELLVKFKEGTPAEARTAAHGRIGSAVIREFRSTGLQLLKLKENLSVAEAIRLYRDDPNVEYAEPVYISGIQDERDEKPRHRGRQIQ